MKYSGSKLLLAILLLLSVNLTKAQKNNDLQLKFKNAPVLIKQNNRAFQQVIVSCNADKPGSSTDWNVAQNFVSVRGKAGQIVVVSDEVPLWQFSDFNMGKFEPNPKPGKPYLYSWVMNNYWFTNFRAYQEAGFSWSYQLTSSKDTWNTFATKFGWGERNGFPTRTFPAGKPELRESHSETLKVDGSQNVLLVNS
ncbi:MAG: hypothetical protein M0Q53_09250 [Prolixibacteraceae bacterium]|jgi:hypothetical protein|nr:hypothetical protein [Prolixibacteraceae bacterium]